MKKKLLFIGPVLTASGYGVHARQLLKSLADSGEFDICVESIRWGDTPFLSGESFDWISKLADKKYSSPDLAIQVTIPNEFKRRAPLMIGVTAGIEVDRVSPEWLLACNNEVDVVVVPSEHSRRSFIVEYVGNGGEKLHLEKPIFVVPEGVDTSVYHPSFSSGTTNSSILDAAGVPNKNFVFVGLGLDKADGRDRKNVTKLIEWFCTAFAGNQDVGLVLKTAIVNASNIDFEVTKKRIAGIKDSTGCGEFPKVTLLHGRFEDSQLAEIYNDHRITAAISLTHGEGFGLPLIEAAACGLPVIATDWSGHLDFLTKNGKKLFVPVEYDLQEIFPECVWPGVMNQGSRWAVAKQEDAITKMKKMVLSSSVPESWASELCSHISENYSLEVTGNSFVELVKKSLSAVQSSHPPSRESLVSALKGKIRARGKSLIYTMPMSAGDVFLSLSVVTELKKKYPDHVIYFATATQYFQIAAGSADEVIEWQPWMQDISVLEDIFDEVFTPNLSVQMVTSNWVHGGKGRNLVSEFAVQCGIDPKTLTSPQMKRIYRDPHVVLDRKQKYVAVHAGGQKSARLYSHWPELVKNIRASGLSVLLVGSKDDIDVGEVDQDVRGIEYNELPKMLTQCSAFVGIDSFPMHVAAAYGLPVVAMFGSSYAKSTGPRDFAAESVSDAHVLVSKERLTRVFNRLRLIETPSRNGCEKACYKDTCKVDAGNPCINNIDPAGVFESVLEAAEHETDHRYEKYKPKISGYTHILNPKIHGYPFIQSIASMIGFCDEVIVVDGGSTDGAIEEIKRELGEYMHPDHGEVLKIITREWDYEEPGMDGMQKAFGRAMVSSDAEFLWQQDADEIVHENDYEKIIDLCKRFPRDVDVLHLPVIELWGDSKHVRTDRHSWKWRLSRNNLRVTHGINSQARLMDPSTGRFYAKQGMSDGCEMIDMVTGEHLPHRGFYNENLERMRREDPESYAAEMNKIFKNMPSVWHYSWENLGRKVKNFRDFWDKQWQVLYQIPAKPRFPDVVTDEDVEKKANELLLRGGEHGSSPTFEIEIEQPSVMRNFK